MPGETRLATTGEIPAGGGGSWPSSREISRRRQGVRVHASARSCCQSELRAGRILQQRLVQIGSSLEAERRGEGVQSVHTEVETLLHIRSWVAGEGDGRSV